ncbi:hypothetical protein [Streptomyces sp. NPDC020377]
MTWPEAARTTPAVPAVCSLAWAAPALLDQGMGPVQAPVVTVPARW